MDHDHTEYGGDSLNLENHESPTDVASEPEQQPMQAEQARAELSQNTFNEKSVSHTPINHDEIDVELSHVNNDNDNTDDQYNMDKILMGHEDNVEINNTFEPTSTKTKNKKSNKQKSIFGNAFTRCVYFACSLFIFSILSFALWFFNVDANLEAGFGLSAVGMFCSITDYV